MTTIASIDFIGTAAPNPVGELAASALSSGAALESAVTEFRRAMAEVAPLAVSADGRPPAAVLPPATPETMKAVLSENAALAAAMPAATPESVKTLISVSVREAAPRVATDAGGDLPRPTAPLAAVVDEARVISAVRSDPSSRDLAVALKSTVAVNRVLTDEIRRTPSDADATKRTVTVRPAAAEPVIAGSGKPAAPVAAPDAKPDAKAVVGGAPSATPVVATPETLNAALAANAVQARQLPKATPEAVKTLIVENSSLAELLPKATVATLAATIATNSALAAEFAGIVTDGSLKDAVAVNRAMSGTPTPAVSRSEAVTVPAESVAKPVTPARPEVVAQVAETVARPDAPVVRPEVVAQVAETVAKPETPARPEVVAQVAETVARPETPVRPEVVAQVAETVAKPGAGKSVEERASEVVLTAAPVAAAPAPVADAVTAVEGVTGVEAVDRVAAIRPLTGAEVLLEAATAVADTMMVTPGLMRGEGEVRVTLKPEVLGGSELRIVVQGGTLTVEFMPEAGRIADLLVASQPQLVQHLSERVHNFQIAVNVNPRRVSGKSRI